MITLFTAVAMTVGILTVCFTALKQPGMFMLMIFVSEAAV
jgi:hypothetical protein